MLSLFTEYPLFYASMSITAFATLRLVEFLDHDKIGLFMLCNHHLSDTLAVIYNKILL